MKTTHDELRRWLGDISIDEFDTEDEIREYFEPANLRSMWPSEDIDLEEAASVRDKVIDDWRDERGGPSIGVSFNGFRRNLAGAFNEVVRLHRSHEPIEAALDNLGQFVAMSLAIYDDGIEGDFDALSDEIEILSSVDIVVDRLKSTGIKSGGWTHGGDR